MSETSVKKKQSWLGTKSKDQFVQELVKLIDGKVIEAYIFGSFYTNDFNTDSDLDLLLITDTKRNFIERPLDFPDLLNLSIPLDLIVYTPEEFAKIQQTETNGFWTTVLSQARRII